MYVCQSPPKNGALLQTWGKSIRSTSTEPHADGTATYNGVRPGSPRVELYYCYYYRVLYSSTLLQNFDSVASVSQISVSATLLVLAEGNYDMRVEEENLLVLSIKIEIKFKYIKQLQRFSIIASSFIKFKHGGRGKMCKRSLRNEENGVKKAE